MLDICVENNDQLSVLQQEEVKINTFCVYHEITQIERTLVMFIITF